MSLVSGVEKYYDINSNEIELGIKGKIQYLNTSLALQIAKYWVANRSIIEFLKKTNSNIYLIKLTKKAEKNFDKLKWIEGNTERVSPQGFPILKPINYLNESIKNGL